GLFMRNWEEGEDCPAEADHQDVVNVAARLEIPFYTVNFTQEYKELVFKDFVEQSLKGLTPNPDILCNREIKFNLLYRKAKELDADFLATGHYARVSSNFELLKGRDPNKDQSYFLYTIKDTLLKDVLFPIGDMPKNEVRRIAKEASLSTHDKDDSTGICFIGERDFRQFLSNYIPITKGPILSLAGKKMGEHMGIAFYTLGQRKGLNIGGAGEPWFVVDKDVKNNALIVAQGFDHPALFSKSLTADTLSFVGRHPPFRCQSKVRYRQTDKPCTVEIKEGVAYVKFDEPQRAVTPGQSIVFYEGEVCLGGGIITSRSQDG
ncbi:MAG: tRNA 2-thiouridine(34) synthase MnmA, partial [Parachlamydiaceae bacterium]